MKRTVAEGLAAAQEELRWTAFTLIEAMREKGYEACGAKLSVCANGDVECSWRTDLNENSTQLIKADDFEEAILKARALISELAPSTEGDSSPTEC